MTAPGNIEHPGRVFDGQEFMWSPGSPVDFTTGDGPPVTEPTVRDLSFLGEFSRLHVQMHFLATANRFAISGLDHCDRICTQFAPVILPSSDHNSSVHRFGLNASSYSADILWNVQCPSSNHSNLRLSVHSRELSHASILLFKYMLHLIYKTQRQ